MRAFSIIHIETGLTLGEYKDQHPLTYYAGNIRWCDCEFAGEAVSPIVRCDGAIGFQRLHPSYGEGDLYFLQRREWKVQINEDYVFDLTSVSDSSKGDVSREASRDV